MKTIIDSPDAKATVKDEVEYLYKEESDHFTNDEFTEECEDCGTHNNLINLYDSLSSHKQQLIISLMEQLLND